MQIASRTPVRTLPTESSGPQVEEPAWGVHDVAVPLLLALVQLSWYLPGSCPICTHHMLICHLRALAGGTHEAANLQSLPGGSTPLAAG